MFETVKLLRLHFILVVQKGNWILWMWYHKGERYEPVAMVACGGDGATVHHRRRTGTGERAAPASGLSPGIVIKICTMMGTSRLY